MTDLDEYYYQIANQGLHRTLGAIDVPKLPTAKALGNADFSGWYRSRTVADDEEATVHVLDDDIDELLSTLDRTLYATTNYQPPNDLEWKRFEPGDDGKQWLDGEKPTPEYADIVGFSIFADIDLADGHKERPVAAGTRETVEQALDEYVASFIELAGGIEHVFVLDSVGGVYLLIAPAATSPIARAFEGEDRGRIFAELHQRANDWLATVRDDVGGRVPAARGVFEADLLNQKNRLYKAPLSIHGSIDGVVHPLDPHETPMSYDFVTIEDVDEQLIEETIDWTREFTDETHATAIDEIIAALWPDYSEEHEDWQVALGSWIADEEANEAKQRRRERQAAEKRARRAADRDDGLPAFTDAIASNAEIGIATSFGDIEAAIEEIDVREVVQELCESFDTDPGREPPRFEPGYRDSSSGTSCFVTSERIVDLDDTQRAVGVLDYVAREEGYIEPTETARGEDRSKARDKLREMGYPIPVYTPAKGSESYDGEVAEKMPGWARAKAAVTLGLCEDEDVADEWRLPTGVHDALLNVLEKQDIDHGCDRLTTDANPDADPVVEAIDDSDPNATFDELMDNARSEFFESKQPRTPPIHRSYGIQLATDALTTELDFIYPREATRGWRETLYVYADGEHVGSGEEAGIYEPSGERTVDRLLERELGMFAESAPLDQIKGKVERRSDTRKRRLDANPERLVVNNGVLDLETGELDPYTPEEYHRTGIERTYDPDAECPNIDNFIHQIVADEDVGTMYRAIAHTLYKGYPGEKSIMLLGGGENGKTVFLTLVEKFLGEWNLSGESLQNLADSDKQFSQRNLIGKLANIDPDIGNQTIQNMATVKALTGNDTVSANVKFERPVQFKNHATILFAANELPVIEDDSHGNWRRWVMIDFPREFRSGDEDYIPKQQLLDRLTTESELDGLLTHCVEEIRDWADRGKGDWFPEVDSPETVRRRMKKASEPVFAFADDCLIIDDDSDLLKENVRGLYAAYANEHNLRQLDKAHFGEQLLNLSDYPIDTRRVKVDDASDERIQLYAGIALSAYGKKLENGGRAAVETDGTDDAGGSDEDEADNADDLVNSTDGNEDRDAESVDHDLHPGNDGVPRRFKKPKHNAQRLRYVRSAIDRGLSDNELIEVATDLYDHLDLEAAEEALEYLNAEDEQ
jgi:putative DNA primase/helicase